MSSYYGNEYIDALGTGDLWATMAWSGDIFWLKRDNPDLDFVVPVEGGLLWATPFGDPPGRRSPKGRSRVPRLRVPTGGGGRHNGVGRLHHPEHPGAGHHSEGRRRFLVDLAASPFVFPTPEMLSNIHTYKILGEDEERAWNDLFQQVVQG